MFEKDLMNDIEAELNALSPEEKERRRLSLQRLLDAELRSRQQKVNPVKKKRWFDFLFKQ